jgi:hypothetical protein
LPPPAQFLAEVMTPPLVKVSAMARVVLADRLKLAGTIAEVWVVLKVTLALLELSAATPMPGCCEVWVAVSAWRLAATTRTCARPQTG